MSTRKVKRGLAPAALALASCGLTAAPGDVAAATATPSARGDAAATRSGRSAPVVETMVVGRTATLLGDTRVRAAQATVHVGGRRCTVGAATPLSVLTAAHRAGAPAVRLRDFGHCTSRPADAGELFVTGVGRDRNHGRDGWEYKVGHRAGTTGAADLSGAFGDGHRLRSGQRVLWFWCVLSTGDSCQRTLEAVPAARHVGAGTPVTVTVTGYDDAGHGLAQAGATVTLAGTSAVTDAQGHATLPAPASAGRFAISAQRAGLVPAFPEVIDVG